MGWDTDIFINHNLKFNNAQDLVDSFKQKMNTDIFIEVYSDNEFEELPAPHTFKGWTTKYEKGLSLNKELLSNGFLPFKNNNTHNETL